MSDDRDRRLGAAIDALPVPPRDEAFVSELLARLEEADAVRSTQGGATVDLSARRRLRRRWLLVAAGATAAAAVFAVMLLGPGGILRSRSGGSAGAPLIGPEPAAAQIIRSSLAATGMARSIQGEMLEGFYRGGVFRAGQRTSFIVDHDGSIDLRASRPTGAAPSFSWLSDWPHMRSARYVYDAGARRETTLLRFTKTMTGTEGINGPSRTIHFTDMGWIAGGLGAGAPYASNTPERLPFFRLRAYLRQVLDSRSPAVSDVTVDGRPAWRVVTTMAVGQGPQTPAAQVVSIVIDKRTRLPLRYSWRAPGEPLAELRLTDLRVDAPQPAGAFTIRFPKGTYKVDANPSWAGWEDHYPIPFGDAAAMRRLLRSVDGEPAFPSWMPAGFVRSAATYRSSGARGRPMTLGTVVLSLSYRRGFDAISVSLQPTYRGSGGKGFDGGKIYVLHNEDPFLDLYGPAYRYMATRTRDVVLRSGPFAGEVAHIVVDPSVMPHLWVSDPWVTATVSGDLSSAEMVRVAESLKAWPQPR